MTEDPFFGSLVSELEQPDDRWLERIRLAEARPPLSRVGSLELLQEIGRGGQGIVYCARQESTGKKVAVKKLLGDVLASYAGRERFTRELAVTQRLEHPGIVKFIGIEVVQSQPHLVMEWIDGVHVNLWSGDKSHRRPIREIIRLFLDIADAVRHAHSRGVIHRDLKPSNILVDSQGKPHILDFGAAAFQAGTVSEGSGLTAPRQFLGTLAYASPEQLSRRPDAIDVRSDVYSLGVILYELLTGRTPQPPGRDPSEMLRRLENHDPARPSSINEQVDRDLDAVSLKALSFDIRERYQSVDALQVDLQRWFDHEPVLARMPDRLYRIQKFTRRHRAGVMFVAAIMASIAAGGMIASVLAVRLAGQYEAAEAARVREADARRTADRINMFLQEILASADPEQMSGPISIRDLLVAASRRIDSDLADDPRVAAAVHQSLGQAWLSVAELPQATLHFQQSLQLAERLNPENAVAIAQSMCGLAAAHSVNGRYSEAEQLAHRALARLASAAQSDPTVHADLFMGLGRDCHKQARDDEAEQWYRRALELRQAHLGAQHRDTLKSQSDLAALLLYKNRFNDAESLLRATLDAQRRTLDSGDVSIAATLGHLSNVLRHREQFDEAEQTLRESMSIYLDSLGPDHPRVATAHTRLAAIQARTGRFGDAEDSLREALRIYKQHDQARDLAVIHHNLAMLLDQQGSLERAEPEFQLALQTLRSSLGPQHKEVGVCMNSLARNMEARGDYAAAVITSTEALAILTNALPSGHVDIAVTQVTLSMSLMGCGRHEEAEQHARSAVEALRQLYAADHFWTACAESVWGEALTNLGRFDEAGPLLACSAKVIRGNPAAGPRRIRDVERRQAQFQALSGRTEETEPRPPRI